MYLVKSTWWLRALYHSSLVWRIPVDEKELFLTFDDGPHETATPFVLDTLKQYNAKGTFFCIGNNVRDYPEIYRRILEEGHVTGNHTCNHLNGWKTDNREYLEDIFEAAKYIDSRLFRPPYGRISSFQARILQEKDSVKRKKVTSHTGNAYFKIIMWDVLSGDFDTNLSPEKCLQYVLLNAEPGSVIVFHDSTKAFDRMSYALPRVLEYFTEKGYKFRAIDDTVSNLLP